MEETIDDVLDLTPEEYKEYKRKHGKHFTKELCEFAVSMMSRKDGNPIEPLKREEVDKMLKTFDVTLEHNKDYDHVFVANMGKADYLGDSIPDMQYLARYIKNVIDDPDGYEGIAFCRWFTDMCEKKIEVPWQDFV